MTALIPIGEFDWVDPLLVNGVTVLEPSAGVELSMPVLRPRVSVYWSGGFCVSVPAKTMPDAHHIAGEIVLQVNNAKRLQERFEWESLKAKEQELRHENRRQERELDGKQ